MSADRDDEARQGREEMVASQIVSRGLKDERILEAMRTVPRELFIRKEDERLAFYDGPLSIGHGQTISQPYIVAYMTVMLDIGVNDRVLEVALGASDDLLAEVAVGLLVVEVGADQSPVELDVGVGQDGDEVVTVLPEAVVDPDDQSLDRRGRVGTETTPIDGSAIGDRAIDRGSIRGAGVDLAAARATTG